MSYRAVSAFRLPPRGNRNTITVMPKHRGNLLAALRPFSRAQLVLFGALLACVGVFVLARVHAAGPPLSNCSSITYTAPSGAANNITFTFNQSYQCGQFANGDWFVLPASPGGAVTVTSMTPDYANGRNGYDVNPNPNQSPQRFNSLMLSYQAPVALPLAVTGNQSLVKTVSTSGCVGNVNCNQFAAVLTVLDTAPADPASTFRPPYTGSTFKTQFSATNLQTGLLQRLSSSCCTDKITNATANKWTKNLRLDYSSNSVDGGGRMETVDGSPDGRGWGADMTLRDTQLVAWLNLDNACTTTPCTAAQDLTAKLPVLTGEVQEGIDLWGAYKQGGGFWRGGGGNGTGKLFNITFAATILNDTGMKSDIANVDGTKFWETYSLWMGTNNQAIWGQPTGNESEYWSELQGSNPSSKTIKDPYGYIDGGTLPGSWYEGITADPVTYMSLMVRIMPQMLANWTHVNRANESLLGFGDRWHTHGALTLPDPCAPKTGTYGTNYGPNGSGGCIPGSGRVPSDDGYKDLGAPRVSAFMEEMYTAFRNNLPTPTPTATPTPTPTPSPSGKIGDLNSDSIVNVFDLSILLSHWGANYAPADLNSDSTVNVFDLSILLSHWG